MTKLNYDQLKFNFDIHDAYGEESFGAGVAAYEGRPVARVDYSLYKDELHIKCVYVADDMQRKRVATNLMLAIQKQYPNAEISFGMSSDEGYALYQSLPKIEAPSKYADKFKLLADMEVQVKASEEKVQRLERESQPEQAELSKSWNHFHKLTRSVDKLKHELYGKSPINIVIAEAPATTSELSNTSQELAKQPTSKAGGPTFKPR